MKPTKARNQQIYRASLTTRSNQLGSHLSADLRKKYGTRSIRVAKGDSVKILRGEYKGVDGKVAKVSTMKNSVAIEGIKKEKSKGDKFDIYIHSSNLIITGLNTDDNWRKNRLEKVKPDKTTKVPKAEEKTDSEKEIQIDEKPESEKEEPKEKKVAKKSTTTKKVEKKEKDD